MGNSNTTADSLDSQLLQKLPQGTSWSFRKCVAHNTVKTSGDSKRKDTARKHNNAEDVKENVENQSSKKSSKKSNEQVPTTGSNEVSEPEGIKVHTWEIPQTVKEFRKTRDLLDHMGLPDLDIEKVVSVYNPTLVQPFTTRLSVLKTRFTEKPEIFSKADWKKNDPKKQREKVMQNYEAYVNRFGWNEGAKVPVVPCLTTGSEQDILEICKFGFDSSSAASFGKFGKGIYVNTPTINNKVTDSHEVSDGESSNETNEGMEKDPKDNSTSKVYLISYAIPGNVFPVLAQDTLKDKPLQGNPVRNGYNSHLVLVDPSNPETVVENSEQENFAGEFVIEQQSQLMPAFLVYVKN